MEGIRYTVCVDEFEQFRWTFYVDQIKGFFINKKEVTGNKTTVSFEKSFEKSEGKCCWAASEKKNHIEVYQFIFEGNELVGITFEKYNSDEELLQSIEIIDLVRTLSEDYAPVRSSLKERVSKS